jgi:hypothetical protein
VTHPALKWSAKDPLPLLPVVTDAPWKIIERNRQIRKRRRQEILRLEMMTQKLNLDLLQLKEVYLSIPVRVRKGKWKLKKISVQVLKKQRQPK